jgi:hypothetical protein
LLIIVLISKDRIRIMVKILGLESPSSLARALGFVMIAFPFSSKVHCHHAFCFQFKYKDWFTLEDKFMGVAFSSNHCIVQWPWGFCSIVSHDYEWASTWNDVHFSQVDFQYKNWILIRVLWTKFNFTQTPLLIWHFGTD